MNQIKLFIELTRLKRPIGFMLLFWPCAWGLTIAYDFSTNLENYFVGTVTNRPRGLPARSGSRRVRMNISSVSQNSQTYEV